MIKRLPSILTATAVFLCAFFLFACANDNEPTHIHNYGAWMSDGAPTHTRECACGDRQHVRGAVSSKPRTYPITPTIPIIQIIPIIPIIPTSKNRITI